MRQRRRDLEAWWVNKMPFAVVENPFELFISVLCMLAGIPYLLGIISSHSVDALLPEGLVFLWGLQLVIGGGLVATGLIRRTIHIEIAGLWQLSAASLIYSLAIIGFAFSMGLLPAAITMAFSFACWSRLFLLRTALRMTSRAQELGDIDG